MTYVIDASAILAVLLDEEGAARVLEVMEQCTVSAVNLSEVVAKLSERGADDTTIASATAFFAERAESFDVSQAMDAGLLRMATRIAGLSLGDRACLAMAQAKGATALTADQAWMTLDLDVRIEAIR